MHIAHRSHTVKHSLLRFFHFILFYCIWGRGKLLQITSICALFTVQSSQFQFNYCVWVRRHGVVQLSPTQTLFIIKIIIVINVKMYVHRILHFWRFKIFHSTKSLQNLFSFFLHWKYFLHLFACESDEFAVLYCEGFCVHDTWLAIHIHVNTYP